MTVEFGMKRAPRYRIAAIRWKGPWSDAKIHAQFLRIAKWAKAEGLKTGHWIFMEPAARTWEVAIELKGKIPRVHRGLRLRTLKATKVAHVVFDPQVVSPAVVYHGLTDWLRWRKKDKTIRSVGSYREVYESDPWKDARASARTNVQITVR
jgi:DNA gyrase inhibitor GyrI